MTEFFKRINPPPPPKIPGPPCKGRVMRWDYGSNTKIDTPCQRNSLYKLGGKTYCQTHAARAALDMLERGVIILRPGTEPT